MSNREKELKNITLYVMTLNCQCVALEVRKKKKEIANQ